VLGSSLRATHPNESTAFIDQIIGRLGQAALINFAGLDFNQRLMFGVDGMEMSRRMVAVIKAEMMP